MDRLGSGLRTRVLVPPVVLLGPFVRPPTGKSCNQDFGDGQTHVHLLLQLLASDQEVKRGDRMRPPLLSTNKRKHQQQRHIAPWR